MVTFKKKFCSYPLKLTATLDFIFKMVGTNCNETSFKSWNMPNPS